MGNALCEHLAKPEGSLPTPTAVTEAQWLMDNLHNAPDWFFKLMTLSLDSPRSREVIIYFQQTPEMIDTFLQEYYDEDQVNEHYLVRCMIHHKLRQNGYTIPFVKKPQQDPDDQQKKGNNKRKRTD